MDENSLRSALAGLPLARVAFFPVTGSTHDIALRWMETDEPDASLVVANEQTAGRGRLERRWHTPPGCALAFSLLLRPREDELACIPRFPALAGLAVCQVLETMGARAQIKWPNDVLADQRKVCGVLAETHWSGGQPAGVVLGVGINVKATAVPADEEVMFPAGCVETALGKTVRRDVLLAEILARLFQLRGQLTSDGFMQQWDQRLAYKGESVRVEILEKSALTGVVLGIDQAGSLLVGTPDGRVEKITAGDVARLRPLV